MLISLVITFVNIILEHIVFKISYLENEKIKTVEQVSIAVKISVSQVLNSVLVPLVLVGRN